MPISTNAGVRRLWEWMDYYCQETGCQMSKFQIFESLVGRGITQERLREAISYGQELQAAKKTQRDEDAR